MLKTSDKQDDVASQLGTPELKEARTREVQERIRRLDLALERIGAVRVPGRRLDRMPEPIPVYGNVSTNVIKP